MIGAGVVIFIGTADEGVSLFPGAFVITKKGQMGRMDHIPKIRSFTKCNVNYFNSSYIREHGYLPVSDLERSFTASQELSQSLWHDTIYVTYIERKAFVFNPNDPENVHLDIYGMKD
jgi:hypothetical protein